MFSAYLAIILIILIILLFNEYYISAAILLASAILLQPSTNKSGGAEEIELSLITTDKQWDAVKKIKKDSPFGAEIAQIAKGSDIYDKLKNPLAYKIKHKGKLAGFVMIFDYVGDDKSPVAPGKRIKLIVVDSAFRGQGLATFAIRKLIDMHGAPFYLSVDKKNTGAIALYEKLGLKMYEETNDSLRYEFTKN